MGTVKLASALPKEPELNGLMDHAGELLRDPDQEVVIIARVSVKTLHDGRWERIRVPELGIIAVEMPTGEDAGAARRLMERAKDQRYARAPLARASAGRMFDVSMTTGEVFGTDDGDGE